MGQNASQTSAQAGVVAGASSDVSRNLQTVATGTEQMSASIAEIAKRSGEAARVAQQAVTGKFAERKAESDAVRRTFRDNFQAERARQIDGPLGDAAAFLGLKITRKFHIDLQLAHGHYVQTAQRGVALAKIVNGQPEAMLGKLLQPFGLRRQAQQRLAFRQFKDQMLRLNSKLFDQVPHVREKLRLEHLAYGNIDRKRQ